jgi:deoxyribonuclease V
MKKLHRWNLSYARARELQSDLACKVEFTRLKESPKLIAGIDCAFSKDGERIFAAVVVLRPPQFELVETVSASRKVTFPYIPGLLSFREAPVCIAAVEKLRNQPDVFILDRGSYSLLRDENRTQDAKSGIIGAVVRTRTNVKPLFISVGNKCRLKDAIRVVLDCTVKYRLPEPSRLAHQTVSKLKLKA